MLVATTLLAIGVVAVLGAVATTTESSYMADRLQQATLLAQQQLGQAQMQAGSLSAGDTSGDFSPGYPDIHWHQSVQASQYPGLYQVTLQVTWGTPARQSMRQFVTYINSTMASNIQQGLINGTTPASQATTSGTSGSSTSGEE
jgi:Tfp pilus assembly protein PilV